MKSFNIKIFIKKLIEFILFYLLVGLLPNILILLGRHASYKNYSGFLATAIYIAIFLISIVIAKKRFTFYSKEKIIHDFHFNDIILCFSIFICILFINAIFMSLNYLIFHQVGTVNNQIIINHLLKINPVIKYSLCISMPFLTPILEELVFRGILTNMFFNPKNIWAKVILSGIIFSSGHISTNIISFLLYFTLGVILALTYLKTDKQFDSIMVHFFVNFTATLSFLFH